MIEHVCEECGDDIATEGYRYCTDCLMTLDRCDPARGRHSTPHKGCILR